LVLLVNDSEHSESTGAKPILSRYCIYPFFAAAEKKAQSLAVNPGFTRFGSAASSKEKKKKKKEKKKTKKKRKRKKKTKKKKRKRKKRKKME
jgi:hypothetical protein